MITQMKYISISGHMSSMEHVITNYLSRFDIQLEQTHTHGLMTPFSTINPYSATLQKAETLAKIAGEIPFITLPTSDAEAVNTIEDAFRAYETRSQKLRELEQQLADANLHIAQLQHFVGINADISNLKNCQFIYHRFGKLPLTHFLQLEKFLANDDTIIFLPAKRDNQHVWGVYLSPTAHREQTDTTFAALKFEPLDMLAVFHEAYGTPEELLNYWHNIRQQLQQEIVTHQVGVANNPRLAIACFRIQNLYKQFDIKKYANISQGQQIFIFSGWIAHDDATQLEQEIAADNLTIFTFHNGHDFTHDTPPTLIKNPPIIRQFEFFTKLYGLPAHGEIDPTPFLAVTYTGLFGVMFGDVGHGLTLAALGLLIHRKWKTPLGGIMTVAGLSAMVFGFLYGSMFGFEDILPALWRRPAQDIPGTLMFAVVLGVGLIVFSMVLSMYNAFRQGKYSQLLFDANGAAGLVFYGSVVLIAVRVFAFGLPISWLVVAVATLPLVFVAFKHPLERYMAQRSVVPPGGIGQFIFNTVIELFETLLTYITNTISFVRVGAFAVSHAGMMHVVLQLSQGAAGTRNWLVVILGNVLVMGVEGLLVGIQVLRLDFYEMFSRFYTGGGKIFKSHKLGER